MSTDYQPTIDRYIDQLLPECWPSVDRLSTKCWPLYRRISRSTLPTVNKIQQISRERLLPSYIHWWCIVPDYPFRPCHYKRRSKETVAPLGIISCYFMVSLNALWTPRPSGLCLYPHSFPLRTLFLLLLFRPLVWIVFCYFYLPCWLVLSTFAYNNDSLRQWNFLSFSCYVIILRRLVAKHRESSTLFP